MPTRLWAVRSALVDLYSETVDVPVFNGPVAKKTPPKEFILVGTDGGATGTGEGSGEGTSTRIDFANVTGLHFNEEGEITCAAWAWSGSSDITTLHDTVAGTVAELHAALIANRQMDALGPAGWLRLAGQSVREWQTPEGAVVRNSFTVLYFARLT